MKQGLGRNWSDVTGRNNYCVGHTSDTFDILCNHKAALSFAC